MCDAALSGARTTEGALLAHDRDPGRVLAFLIPSTSGRAALAIPATKAFFTAPDERKHRRAFALLIPLDWAVWGAPFALTAGAVRCFVVTRTFLTPAQRRVRIAAPLEQGLMRPAEWKVLIVLAALVALWVTASVHAMSIAMTSVCAAVILMAPRLGVISITEGFRAVSWRIVVFVAAALAMGAALMESGAAEWTVETPGRRSARRRAPWRRMMVCACVASGLAAACRNAPP